TIVQEFEYARSAAAMTPNRVGVARKDHDDIAGAKVQRLGRGPDKLGGSLQHRIEENGVVVRNTESAPFPHFHEAPGLASQFHHVEELRKRPSRTALFVHGSARSRCRRPAPAGAPLALQLGQGCVNIYAISSTIPT